VKKKIWTDISWIANQLRATPQQQLKLNGESARNIMTTFAFPYVSYLLYDTRCIFIWTLFQAETKFSKIKTWAYASSATSALFTQKY